MPQTFQLIANDPGAARNSIRGTIDVQTNGALALQYQISGEPTRLLIPGNTDKPTRRDKLWRETCLELFVTDDSERYFEFNFSPSGDWQCYEFLRYRQPSNELVEIAAPTIHSDNIGQELVYTVELDISPLAVTTPLRIGIAAILQHHDGHLDYYSLAAPRELPDFHLRDSFILSLP